jgi:hypothetical protein
MQVQKSEFILGASLDHLFDIAHLMHKPMENEFRSMSHQMTDTGGAAEPTKPITNNMESAGSTGTQPAGESPSKWWKIALVSAGSALAGGVAAAWWYRKTLTKLQESGETPQDPHFGIFGSGSTSASDEDS